MTAAELRARLATLCAEALTDALESLAANGLTPVPQPADGACYAPPRTQIWALPGAAHIGGAIAGKWLMRMALQDVFYDNDKVTDDMIAEYAQPLRKPGYMRVLAGLSRHFFSETHAAMQLKYMDLDTPLEVVWGQQDTWLPPEFGRQLADTVPNARLELVEEAGHSPHQEQPEVFNKRLAEFLKEGA